MVDVIIATPTVLLINGRCFACNLLLDVQAAMSFVQNLEVFRYSGAAIMEISVGACRSIHYWVYARIILLLYYRGPLLGMSLNRESKLSCMLRITTPL